MPFSPKTLEEKPYNACLNCNHIGKDCDGPNFLAMSSERWCEWCKLRKDYLGWTNAKVAELAGIAKISVDRVMSGNIKDIRTSTMQAITRALVNGSWGQYPCAMPNLSEASDSSDLLSKLEKAEENCCKLEKAIDALKADHRDDINYMKAQMAEKDKLLSERYEYLSMKDKVIRRLTVSLVAVVSIIFVALIANIVNHDIGFFF